MQRETFPWHKLLRETVFKLWLGRPNSCLFSLIVQHVASKIHSLMHANRSHPTPKTVCWHTNSLRCAVIGHRVRIRSPVPVHQALSSITRAANPAANPEICAGSKCCGSTSRNTGAAGLNSCCDPLQSGPPPHQRYIKGPYLRIDAELAEGKRGLKTCLINNNQTSNALMKQKHLEESKRRARSVKL